MDDEDTLPLKRVEFSLTKFNEVAIPHHLDLLRQHKANIIKEVNLQEREALLRGCSELQAELLALHQVWEDTQRAALAQREQVSAAESSVAVAADNIGAARQYLALGERLRAGAWGAGGAALGLVAAGPVGVMVGAKAGALAAAAGSVLGYLGASILARRRTQPEPDPGADKTE